jgi:hypothetical protein
MLAPNNTIFNSKAAQYGAWFKIFNYSALSVHIVGLESGSDTWIEVSNNPDDDPRFYPNSPPIDYPGVPITGNLAAYASYSPPISEDVVHDENIAWSTDGKQVMWSPACLVWNYLRVVKVGGGSVTTTAYLFGQIST